MDPFKGGKAWISGKAQKAWDTVNKYVRKWPQNFFLALLLYIFLKTPKKGKYLATKNKNYLRERESRRDMLVVRSFHHQIPLLSKWAESDKSFLRA